MKFQKRFVAIAAIVVIIVFFKFHVGTDRVEDVEQFRGANIKQDVFGPMIAQSINSKLLTVTLNDQTYNNEQDGIFMSNDLNIMVPSEVLMEGLRCSAKVYDGSYVMILQGEDIIGMEIDEKEMSVNEEVISIESAAQKRNGKVYVPIQQLQKVLHFSVTWDSESNTAIAVSSLDDGFLPQQFDLRNFNRVGKVRDQGEFGTCWAFASLGAIHSTLLPNEEEYFSVDHMSMRNSFSSDQLSGGEYTMGMAYLTSWQGPVYEKDDPYGDGYSPDNLKAEKHIQEIQLLEADNHQEIKESIFKYGAVQASIYCDHRDSRWYNNSKAAYYYAGTDSINHDIIIIGWDDSFSASHFATKPSGDGAFICQNSWGKNFGNKGIFYVSYYDSHISSHCISYKGIEDKDNYDRIYQSDLCGWCGQLGYTNASIYAANVFSSVSDEYLSAVGFYATGRNTAYEVYVVTNFERKESLKEGWQVASGTLEKAGYYTISLQNEVKIKEGEKFAVVLKIVTPGATRPLAVETVRDRVNVDLEDGESYISANGKKWESTEEVYGCNVCLKAYTRKN